MLVFDKNDVKHTLTENDERLEKFGIKKLMNENELNQQFYIDGNISSYGIGMGIVDEFAYVSFYCAWISLQFRVTPSSKCEYRLKYGNNEWTSWANI